ncbi:MAG: alpha/beta hydrolase [Actinobacteria bacterium]|nr:alpha/beta hydrolase [Actinomycetota bacterium]
METLSINGLDLQIVDEGNSEVPLFLVHGYTGGASDWDDVAPALAQSRRVIRYSHRGHAQSTNTGDPKTYTFDALVNDLGAVVDHFGFDQIDLLGHSMGGVVAMRYVLDHPAKARSLVLMDTGAAPAGSLPIDLIDGLAERGRNEGMQIVVDVMAPFIGALQERLAPERRDELARRYAAKMPFMDPDAFAQFARELNEYPSMVGKLHTIMCPTTVIVGENDAGLREASEVMAKEIPGAELVVIADAGHSPQEDHPDEWLRVVEHHLSRV